MTYTESEVRLVVTYTESEVRLIVTYTESKVSLVAVMNLHGEVLGFGGWEFTLLVQQIKIPLAFVSISSESKCKAMPFNTEPVRLSRNILTP